MFRFQCELFLNFFFDENMCLFELFSQVNNKIIVLFLVSVNTIRLWDNGNVMLCYFKHSLFYNDRAHRMTIKFKLNWKRNRNLIVTLFSFAINIAVNEKKLSLCREKHVHTGMVHVWVRLYVHAFQILFHLYDGLISIFSSPKITSTLNNICSRITFFMSLPFVYELDTFMRQHEIFPMEIRQD